MPLRILTLSHLESQGVARAKQVEPALDATVYGQHALNLIRSAAYGVYPVTLQIEDAYNNAFVQFSHGDTLDNFHGTQENTPRIAASHATGEIVIYGVNGATIAIGEKFTYQDKTIQTTAAGVIAQRTLNVTSGAANNGIVTLNVVAHNHPVGGQITVNVGNVNFDGTYTIVGTAANTISYAISNQAPLAVGAGTISSYSVVVSAQTLSTGIDANILGSQALSGNYEAYILNRLVGGAEQETDAAYSSRIIKVRNLLEGVFTAQQIELAALLVAGNTRAWVVSPKVDSLGNIITGGTSGTAGYKPQPGQVCVYVVQDGNPNAAIPPAVLLDAKNSIIANGKMPAHTIAADIQVFEPIIVNWQFTIQGLLPNTNAMKAAIEKELRAYMEDYIDFEQGFSLTQQIGVVARAKDSSGMAANTFNITSAAMTANSGTLYRYGGVTWI
jgi:hypothetical protein